MWDDRSVFRALWQRIARLFGSGKSEDRRVPGSIPAPETLVAKVANVKNKDRDILRVAGEAVRRGHPDQAVIAYWKAVQVYLKDGQLLKAVSALKMIIQHAPEDLEAFNALADAYEALDRRRDAANTCLWIADIHARRGERVDALAVLYRAMDLDPMVRGARERIQALGGDLPAAARPPSVAAPQLRLQSKQEPPAPAAELPPIQGIPLTPPGVRPASVVDDDDQLELDIEGDDALDFPDDSLVLPVTDPKQPAPEDLEPEGTVMADDDEIASEGDSTIAMGAIDADEGAATIAMHALSSRGEVMSVDLAGDATVLAMEAPPWDGPTDEHGTEGLDSFEDTTDPPVPSAPRRFAIPSASTTVDLNPPSAMVGSEHDPRKPEPKVGIPGESTRAYSVEELRRLGVKLPEE
jgi:hypothetical protein